MQKIVEQNLVKGQGTNLIGNVFQQLGSALIAGMIGFSSFLSVLVITNIFYRHPDIITAGDFLLSSIGFICLFALSFLERINKKDSGS